MRALVRALGAACAGLRAASVCIVSTLLASIVVLSSSDACADPPSAPRRDGPFVIRLAMENDNLFFGTYGRMAGPTYDGNDLGRTHGSAIGVGYDLGDRTSLRLDVSSDLYTRSIDGSVPALGAMVPVHYHELDRFRLGVGLGRDAPWRVRLGAALEISNHEHVTIGASGQQRMWHDFVADTLHTDAWQFDHRPSGQSTQVGGAIDATAGGVLSVALLPWLVLRASGVAGGRLGSIVAGTALVTRGRVAVSIGDPDGARLVIAAMQRAQLWLGTGGVLLRSSFSARLDLDVLAFELAFHRYDGDQNEPYFFYAVSNTTMIASLVVRI